jgi:hypothetical protein
MKHDTFIPRSLHRRRIHRTERCVHIECDGKKIIIVGETLRGRGSCGEKPVLCPARSPKDHASFLR